MSFRPLHGDHSIAEVVLQFVLDRVINLGDVQELEKMHKAKWTAELPKIDKSIPGSLNLTPGGIGQQNISGIPIGQLPLLQQMGGISMSSHRRDGSIDWRLFAEGNSITVNCTSYSGWKKVWSRASEYLVYSLRTLGKRGCNVLSCCAEYINLFIWEGEVQEADPWEVIQIDAPQIPSAVRDKGAVWHAHSGWYLDPITRHTQAERFLIDDGRLLERVDIDVVNRSSVPMLADKEGEQPVVKIQIVTRRDMKPTTAFLISNDKLRLDKEFGFLHEANKSLFSSILRPELSERIRLHA